MRTKAAPPRLTLLARALLLRRRVPRHPASGQELQKGSRQSWIKCQGNDNEDREKNTSEAYIRKADKKPCRRVSSPRYSRLRAGCTAIASMTAGPFNKVRVPRIDSRAIGILQRWADDEKESWPEEL